VRGGLDDALEKLARRDELRRRAAGQTTGTPPAVTELVEAVAAVVARNPERAITMGVEGAGDPILLTFAVDDGIVQVSADNPLTAQVTDESAGGHRHADFDLDPDPEPHPVDPDPADFASADFATADFVSADFATADFASAGPPSAEADEPPYAQTAWRGERFADEAAEPTHLGYADDPYAADRAAYSASYADDGGGQETIHLGHEDTLSYNKKFGRAEPVYDTPPAYERPTAFGRPEDRAEPAPSPYAATPPPPVPPQTRGTRAQDDEPAQRQMPAPMPTPMPLRVEPEVTELAAKRLAAMLREDPSLLQPNPHD
jgi:hypothetical protein